MRNQEMISPLTNVIPKMMPASAYFKLWYHLCCSCDSFTHMVSRERTSKSVSKFSSVTINAGLLLYSFMSDILISLMDLQSHNERKQQVGHNKAACHKADGSN